MWISKKKWDKLQRELSVFEKFVENYIRETNKDLTILFSYVNEKKLSELLKKENANTKLIQNVTLEELAKLVIDGTPIKRTEKIDMTTEFHGRV